LLVRIPLSSAPSPRLVGQRLFYRAFCESGGIRIRGADHFALSVRPHRLDVRVRSEVLVPALRTAQASGVSASDLAIGVIGVIGVAANDMRSGSSNARRSVLEIITASL